MANPMPCAPRSMDRSSPTVLGAEPREASCLVTGGVFSGQPQSNVFGIGAAADRVGDVARHGESLARSAVVRDPHICRADRSGGTGARGAFRGGLPPVPHY